jgi:hypothetical protein
MFGLFSIVSKYLSGGAVSFEDGGSLKIAKEANGKYYWTFSFVSGRVEKSFDGFGTPAEAKKDFQYRSRYFVNGGNVSVDGGRDGDWLEDKYGTGGRIKDSEINVGNRFGLINGEVVEIKKRFIDPRYKGDDSVVVFTRSSDGKEHENTVNTLRIFLNNTKAQLINKHTEEVLGEKYWTKYKDGGSVESDIKSNKGAGYIVGDFFDRIKIAVENKFKNILEIREEMEYGRGTGDLFIFTNNGKGYYLIQKYLFEEFGIASKMDNIFNGGQRGLKINGNDFLEDGGKLVKHLDIPNTMLDFTLKPKMENGGSAKKVKTIAPEHTCFVVVGSHRAMDKVRSIFEGKNVPYITLWSVSAKKSAATVVINIFERNYNLIERIKGVGKPSYALLSETKWHSRGESEVLDEKFKMVNDDEVYNTKQYQLGDKYSEDFDYEGMLRMALTVNENWSVDNLNKLYDSFEDVNYNNVNATLWKIIGYLKEGKESLAKAYIIIYKKKIAELLAEEYSEQEQQASKMVKGGTVAQKRKVGKVMHEFKHGNLKSHGRVVTDRNQAIAIALSEAGLSKKEEGGIIENFKLPSTDFVPITNGGIPSYNTPLDHWALYYEKGGKIKN